MNFENDNNYLDQHFLIDQEVIKKYINFANINKDDVIVEIGPGKGTLTNLIAPLCKKLICIEKDIRLKSILEDITVKYNNTVVIYDNVLNTYIPKCNKIITSLPYSIIEPFINKLIKCDFEELIMLMGSTYVDNVCNNSITRLSVITNSYFKTERLLEVLPSSFDYPPRTLSTIVRITKVPFSLLSDKYKIYNRLVFHQTKLIKNALIESIIDIKHITKKETKLLVSELNIPTYILEEKFNTISNEYLKELDKYLDNINF